MGSDECERSAPAPRSPSRGGFSEGLLVLGDLGMAELVDHLDRLIRTARSANGTAETSVEVHRGHRILDNYATHRTPAIKRWPTREARR
jgi:hypothetical protein